MAEAVAKPDLSSLGIHGTRFQGGNFIGPTTSPEKQGEPIITASVTEGAVSDPYQRTNPHVVIHSAGEPLYKYSSGLKDRIMLDPQFDVYLNDGEAIRKLLETENEKGVKSVKAFTNMDRILEIRRI